MRIAISVENKNELNSIVAHHFGRCPYFAFIDLDERNVNAIQIVENPYFNGHQPGQVPRFIKQQGADVMLSGGMGGRAIQYFQEFGIQTATGARGTVHSAVESYLNCELIGAAACKESVDHGHG